jgi:hypothetical protein
MVWNSAGGYCQQLTLGGNGWRLPSAKELLTLVDPSRYDPAIDLNAFPDTKSVAYWSASIQPDPVKAAPSTVALAVDFKLGSAGVYAFSPARPARCVR